MVGALLSLPEPPEPDHAADALAVAICHAHGAALRARRSDDRVRSGHGVVRRPDAVVRRGGGVGYRLAVSAAHAAAGPGASASEAFLHSHLIMRDDAMHLYGFATEDERDLFLHAARRAGRRPEGGARGAVGRHHRRAPERDRRRRRGALPGRARDRQADRRADHRRAAREGRRGGEADEIVITRDRRPARRWRARPARARLHAPGGGRAARRSAEGESRRGADRGRAAARARHERRIRTPGVEARAPTSAAIQTPARRPRTSSTGRCAPSASRTSSARRAVKEQLEIFIEAARGPRRGARPRAAGRPARPGQDLAGADRRRRARGAVHADRRPGAGAQGRRRRLPDGARAAQRLLRRRDPPPAPGARGDVLSRDGGPQAADHGRGRAPARDRHAQPARLHADRRDHARRPADHAAARPLRRHPPARPLRRRRPRPDRHAAAPASSSATIDQAGAETIARRSRGTPRVANRLLKRVRDFAEVRHAGAIDAHDRRRRARPARGRRRRASTGSTARSCARSARSSTAGRSGSRRSRSWSPRRRTRSRTSTSPTCSRRASSSARRAAASPPPRPSSTSGCERPPGRAGLF